MKVFNTQEIEWSPVVHNARSGVIERKFIREDELSPGVGYGCDLYHYVASDESFATPRHRHDFDQIRFAISGSMNFGRGLVCPEGWIAYFPAGAFYGPQEIDEASIFIIQWSENWVSRVRHDQAMVEMSKSGSFEGGFFTATDQDGRTTRKDSLNAIWEHVFKRRSRFPAPRYAGPVLVNPDAFSWGAERDGVQIKSLGRFTEGDLHLYKVRWVGEATYTLTSERTSCLFVLEGAGRVESVDVEPHSMIWSDLGEETSVQGAPGTEAICIGFPPHAVEAVLYEAPEQ